MLAPSLLALTSVVLFVLARSLALAEERKIIRAKEAANAALPEYERGDVTQELSAETVNYFRKLVKGA
jgi:hypothetical protein